MQTLHLRVFISFLASMICAKKSMSASLKGDSATQKVFNYAKNS